MVAWSCLILFGAPDDSNHETLESIISVGAVLALVAMAMYLSTACTDPGIVFKPVSRPVTGDLPPGGQHRGAAGRGSGDRSSAVVVRQSVDEAVDGDGGGSVGVGDGVFGIGGVIVAGSVLVVDGVVAVDGVVGGEGDSLRY